MSFTEGPRVVIWLLTSRCNLTCCHCYTAKFLKEKEFSEEQALELVETMANSGVMRIGFTGGEVFRRQDALRLIERASELRMSASMVTNGSLLTEEIARRLFLNLSG